MQQRQHYTHTHAAGTHVLRIRKRKRKRHFAVNSSSSPTQLTKCRPYLNCPVSYSIPPLSCSLSVSLSPSATSLPLLGVLCGTFHSIHLPFPVSIRFGRQLHNTKREAWLPGRWRGCVGVRGVDPLMSRLATI